MPGDDAWTQARVGGPVPVAEVHNASAGDDLTPPLIQGVFDIETWGLTRDWGVMLVFSMLVHRGGQPEWVNYSLDQAPTWPDKRSNDRWLAEKALAAIAQCHVVYAHNGERFDVRWLRTLALKYDLPFNEKKLVDPCQVAFRKYALGSNSLENLAQFLGLSEQKMPVGKDVWRAVVMDNDPEAWATLKERCQSDVRVLNAVAARVTRDVGMIDKQGSWR